MVLSVKILNVSNNDADYFARSMTDMGAKSGIYFNDDDTANVYAVQVGRLEAILGTASVAFHANTYDVHISEGGEYDVEKENWGEN